jgi:hypothetical protein
VLLFQQGNALSWFVFCLFWLVSLSYSVVHPLIPGLVRKYGFGGYMIGNDSDAGTPPQLTLLSHRLTSQPCFYEYIARSLFSFNILWPSTMFILMTMPVWVRISGFVKLWVVSVQRQKVLAKDTVQLLASCKALLSDVRLASAISDPGRAAMMIATRQPNVGGNGTTGSKEAVSADSYSPSFWQLLGRRMKWNLAETVHLWRRQSAPLIYLSRVSGVLRHTTPFYTNH